MLHSLLSTKTCQVCMRSFPNGKALGGHMRSHARKYSLPKAKSSATHSTIPTLQASNKLGATFTPGETVLVRSVHTNEVGVGPKPDLKTEDGGQQVTGKRKFLFDLNEVYTEEPQSSLTVEEESALLLVEMSKGKRPANFQSPTSIDPPLVSTREGKEKCTEKDTEMYSEDEDIKFLTSNGRFLIEDSDKEEEEDDDDETYLVPRDEKCKKRYKCEICGKVLRSYQALGGHRTSHKKRLKIGDKNDEAVVPRQYPCVICEKVFGSGQALGGHKKVHLAYLEPCR